MTAMSPPGKRGARYSKPTMIARTTRDDGQARELCFSDVSESEEELPKKAIPALFDAEHFVQFTRSHLHTHA
jgi:hypothetical protein